MIYPLCRPQKQLSYRLDRQVHFKEGRENEPQKDIHFPKGTSIPFSSHSALSREFFVIYFSMSWIIGSILLTCYSFHLVGRGNDRRQGNTLRTRYPPRANGRELPAVLVSVILPRLQTIAYYVFLPTFMHLIGRGAQTQQRNILRTRYPPPARRRPRPPHSCFRDPSATSDRHLLCFPDNIPASPREREADPAGKPLADSLSPARRWPRTPSILSGLFWPCLVDLTPLHDRPWYLLQGQASSDDLPMRDRTIIA